MKNYPEDILIEHIASFVGDCNRNALDAMRNFTIEGDNVAEELFAKAMQGQQAITTIINHVMYNFNCPVSKYLDYLDRGACTLYEAIMQINAA